MATQVREQHRGESTPHERRDERDNSLGGLLKELREDALRLMRQELSLAKQELYERERGSMRALIAIGTGLAFAAAGGFLALQGLAVLGAVGLEAAGIDGEIAAWLSPLAIGVLVLLIGWGTYAGGKKRLRAHATPPTQTLDSLKETSNWAREKATP